MTLTIKSLPYRFWVKAFNEWSKIDMPVLIYMFKATLAGLMALAISMILNLPDPRTAIFTSFLVMQPQTGLVFSKSYYRIIGTTVGVGMSLVIVGAFAQDPVWFIALFAAWIGLCTAAGFKYRNFQAYGFVLAGYTVCIVVLPVIETPLEVFDIAISRFSEVIVGILCATIISDILFPRHLSTSLIAAERERFVNVLGTLCDPQSLFHIFDSATMSRFSSGVVGLHASRINSSFESHSGKKERLYYQHLNYEFMNLSTTYHSLKNILARIKADNNFVALYTLEIHYSHLSKILARYTTFSTLDSLSSLITELTSLHKNRSHDLSAHDDIPSAFFLIERLTQELTAYATTYKSFLLYLADETTQEKRELEQNLRFQTHSDNLLVGLAAFRGTSVFLITIMFWLVTGWPYATQTITLAVVLGLLIGTLPSPLDVVMNFFKGGISALVIAALMDFYLIPLYASDLLSFSLLLAPILAIVAWLTTKPKWSGFSLGFIFIFMYQCALDPYYKIDPTHFLESGLSYIIGILFAGTAYMMINFWSCSWTQRRVAKLLATQIVTICQESSTMTRSGLETIGRDLIQQFSTHGRLNMRSSRLVFEWLLSTLEIGRALLNLKLSLQTFPHEGPIFTSTMRGLRIIQTMYARGTFEDKDHVIKILLTIIDRLHRITPSSISQKHHLETLIIEFQLIRTLLSNESSLPKLTEDLCR